MRLLTLLVTAMVAATAGCGGTGGGVPHATITGEAFYRERIAVPPGTQLEVVLEDVTRVDVAARTIGRELITNAGQPPYRFEIRYPTERIIDSHRYAVRARLIHEGQLLFATDRRYPVITGGAPTEVKLLLRRVSTSPADASSSDCPLGAVPATCQQGIEQAQRFRNALGSVAGHRILGQHLEILDRTGTMPLRFEAVALR